MIHERYMINYYRQLAGRDEIIYFFKQFNISPEQLEEIRLTTIYSLHDIKDYFLRHAKLPIMGNKQDAHEALVRKIAEEMAEARYKSDFPNIGAWNHKSESSKNHWIDEELIMARIAVKHMAEEFKMAYCIALTDTGQFMSEDDPDCKEAMKERGLIQE